MKVFQINTTVNTTSTGRIAEEIGLTLMNSGHESYIAGSRVSPNGSASELIKIGNKLDVYLHGAKTRLFDLHGFGSKRATRQLVKEIEKIDPDVIGLHNLHGYYLNVEILFNYLKKAQKPVVWTLHDCWSFTGHCAHFESIGCMRWKDGCFKCPQKRSYPSSFFIDNSENNYINKRELFRGLSLLTIVTPSMWLKSHVNCSFLNNYPAKVINNGIDLDKFCPTDEPRTSLISTDKKIVLGVANIWTNKKGLNDFLKLSKILPQNYQIVLVGMSEKQVQNLPKNIIGIKRTESISELAHLYNIAEVFVNPTWSDTFPTTNLEALGCGTPVITYNTGGSPETIDEKTGFVVEQGDINGIVKSINQISQRTDDYFKYYCRKYAVDNFSKNNRFQDYIELYEKMVNRS